MATIGANISYRQSGGLFDKIMLAMHLRVKGRQVGMNHDSDPTNVNRIGEQGTKYGIPASNTVADAPSGINDLCYDGLNKQVYRCSAYVDNTNFTWTKIS